MAVALDIANERPKRPARRELAPERGQPLLSIAALRASTCTEILDPLAVKPVPVNEGSFPW